MYGILEAVHSYMLTSMREIQTEKHLIDFVLPEHGSFPSTKDSGHGSATSSQTGNWFQFLFKNKRMVPLAWANIYPAGMREWYSKKIQTNAKALYKIADTQRTKRNFTESRSLHQNYRKSAQRSNNVDYANLLRFWAEVFVISHPHRIKQITHRVA